MLQCNKFAQRGTSNSYDVPYCQYVGQHVKSDFVPQAKKPLVDLVMKRLMILCAILSICLLGPSRADPVRPGLQNCFSGAPAGQRQLCDEEASEQVKAGSRIVPLEGGWRLVWTKDPGSGTEAVSVMHAADTAKSDINLAGLNLRCGREGIEVVLIVLQTLPRASHPRVALATGSNRAEFESSVAQGGEVLLLPQAATDLAAGDWQKAAELSIEIATESNSIRGIVPIGGLSAALRTLSQNCATRR